MGAVGRQLIIDKFTTDRVNAATMEVYQTILQNAKKNRQENSTTVEHVHQRPLEAPASGAIGYFLASTLG